jgi:hypothetical protein
MSPTLASLGVTMQQRPVAAARGSWTWRFMRDGAWFCDIDVPDRTMRKSRDAAARRALTLATESR